MKIEYRQRMRSIWLAVLLLAACKDKQEAKPAPAPAAPPVAKQAPAPAQEPAPPPEPAKPTAPAPIKPAGGFTTTADYEAKALELTDQLTAVFEKAGTSCGKLADALDTFVAAHEKEIAGANAFEAANPGAEDALQATLQPKARKLVEKMSISMQACQNDQRVKDALARIPSK